MTDELLQKIRRQVEDDEDVSVGWVRQLLAAYDRQGGADVEALRADVDNMNRILGDYRNDNPDRDAIYLKGKVDGAHEERRACLDIVEHGAGGPVTSGGTFGLTLQEVAKRIRARGPV